MEEEISIHVNDSHQQADLGLIHMKLQEIVQILTNYKSQPQEKSRSAYIDELTDLIMTYYEYNRELAEYFVALFPPAELVNFLEASQSPRPLVIRTNTLMTKRRELAQSLIQKGVNLDPVGEWNKVGLKIIDSQVPIGATTEYLAGHYMLQSASSFLPVMALAPKPGERVLDLCAAPGGKTTHIGQLMKNSGVIVANEFNPDRCASIKGNIHRMGLSNVIITNYDGRKVGKVFKGFDRALVDAPCSGLGVIWKDPSVKALRTLKDIKRNSHIQKELLLAAIDAVTAKSATGGYIVYSTCSVSIEENEEVVNYALKNRKVKVVDTGLTIGEPGFHKFKGKIFHPSLVNCKRIYPHVYNMEGFFVAKLKKLENNVDEEASKPHSGEKRESAKKIRRKAREQAEKMKEEEKMMEVDKDDEEGEVGVEDQEMEEPEKVINDVKEVMGDEVKKKKRRGRSEDKPKKHVEVKVIKSRRSNSGKDKSARKEKIAAEGVADSLLNSKKKHLKVKEKVDEVPMLVDEHGKVAKKHDKTVKSAEASDKKKKEVPDEKPKKTDIQVKFTESSGKSGKKIKAAESSEKPEKKLKKYEIDASELPKKRSKKYESSTSKKPKSSD